MRQGRYLEVFQAIKDYHEENPNFPIQTLCRILKVSRSGYDKWLKHPETPSERVNKELMATIKSFHHRYNGILGYRRMTAFVNRQLGTQYNKKRIRRLMPILGIRSVIRRVRHACTKSGDKYYEETILNRYFTTQAGLTLSMSRVVKCIDNAPIESFFGHFKTESYHLQHYKTFEELVTAIDDYISFYNTQRYQEKLNNLTPLEFRNQVA